MSIYLYGFTLADAPHRLEGLSGVDERNVFMVTVGEVSALVSNYGYGRFEVRGKDIFAHQQVIRSLNEEASIIPLEFGLTLKDLSAVESVICSNHSHLKRELYRIFRKVEMEVSLRFATGDLFRYMVAKYPHLKDERYKFKDGRLLYSIGDRARKGEKFEIALKKEKEIFASKVAAIIGPWCAEIAQAKSVYKERDVATFNCLVNRERLKVFENSIYQAGELYCGDLLFTFNGPWAPQNFCNLGKISYA